jgi:hypothetical protein
MQQFACFCFWRAGVGPYVRYGTIFGTHYIKNSLYVALELVRHDKVMA